MLRNLDKFRTPDWAKAVIDFQLLKYALAF